MNTVSNKPSSAFSFMVRSNEFFIVIDDTIDITGEIKKLQNELDYHKGFLKSVENKLNNKQFINNAPEQVVMNEKNKMTDAKSKIMILEAKIVSLQ
jgi:valyl-tRNA synthetase